LLEVKRLEEVVKVDCIAKIRNKAKFGYGDVKLKGFRRPDVKLVLVFVNGEVLNMNLLQVFINSFLKFFETILFIFKAQSFISEFRLFQSAFCCFLDFSPIELDLNFACLLVFIKIDCVIWVDEN
jgi:hypothetical protein